MPAARRVQREWLDELPADDPRAVRSRRDLIRVNTWMLQPGIMARALLQHHSGPAPRTILDLGSGDGAFMLAGGADAGAGGGAMSPSPCSTGRTSSARATRRGFDALGWSASTITADLFGALESGQHSARRYRHRQSVPASLHRRRSLAPLLARLAQLAPLFVACEPRRAALPLLASRLLWAIGCNDVTRHDAVVSVEAGFAGTRTFRDLAGAEPLATARAGGAAVHPLLCRAPHPQGSRHDDMTRSSSAADRPARRRRCCWRGPAGRSRSSKKTSFPRRKVCGEFISATSMPLLHELGLLDDFVQRAGPPVRRVGLFARDATLAAPMPQPRECQRQVGQGAGPRASRLAAARHGRARAGAEVWQPWKATELRRTGAGYRLHDRGGERLRAN